VSVLTVEHLTKDRMRGSREIEIERVVGLLSAILFDPMEAYFSKIVKLKDKFLGEVIHSSPDNPSNTNSTYHQLQSGLGDLLIPYLCPEALILCTLGILKSHSYCGYAKGATNPPEAAST